MKKNIFYILIIIILAGIFTPVYKLQAQTPLPTLGTCTEPGGGQIDNVAQSDCQDPGETWSPLYVLLAPLPNPNNSGTPFPTFDPSQTNNLGVYLNMMITIFIGICAVLSVVMIVIGGMEYMTSELIASKEEGKERILHAIFGLLLALGAWTILNQINPDILKTDLGSLQNVTVSVTADTANFAKTEQTAASVGTGYKTNTPDAGVSSFAQNNCSSLSNITVNTSTKQANFCSGSNCVSVPVNLGYQGVATAGQAQAGDNKTPIGTFTIGGTSIVGTNGKAAVANGYNFGAAFVGISASINGTNRGIGFHGNETDTLGTTNGCIRMTNDDLALLAPCMKAGTTVSIQ